MQRITCPHCKKQFELTDAFQKEVVELAVQQEKEKFQKEFDELREKEKETIEKRLKAEMDLQLKDKTNEAQENKDRYRKLQEEMLEMNKVKRELEEKNQRAELEMQKKLQEEREKMKDEVGKIEAEKADLRVSEMKKKLEDTQKALDEARRKTEQGSQQLQGEVLELELEELLRAAFAQDEIIPIAKGVHGADIRHIVKSPRGFECGVILWEFKRTKRWEDKWLEKLKQDMRNEKAHVSVIISTELPRGISHLGLKDGVWVASNEFVLPLAELLRKNLLDVGYQKAIMANKSEKADLLYGYVTSHEFQQQVEMVVETYVQMQDQISKERIAFERQWKLREAQIHKLLMGTASVIGSMQGKVGASMPQIKGLNLLEGE